MEAKAGFDLEQIEQDLDSNWWKARNMEAEKDLIAVFASTIDFPGYVACYYSSQNDFKFEVNWRDMMTAPSKQTIQVGNPQFCMSYTIKFIFEFLDVNKNGVFDESDIFLGLIRLENLQWKQMSIKKPTPYSILIEAEEENGDFLAQWEISSIVENSSMLSPNATKFTLELRNYQLKHPEAQLLVFSLEGLPVDWMHADYRPVDKVRKIMTNSFLGYYGMDIQVVNSSGNNQIRNLKNCTCQKHENSNQNAWNGAIDHIIDSSNRVLWETLVHPDITFDVHNFKWLKFANLQDSL